MRLTPEHLEARRKTVGGSSAASALGLNPWQTPLQLYLDKRGELPEEDIHESRQWLMDRGNILEPFVRAAYERLTGRTVARQFPISEPPLLHAGGILSAHPDGLTSDGRCVEIKVVNRWIATKQGWGEPGTDEIPLHYVVQVQVEMACLSESLGRAIEVCDVVGIFGGPELDIIARLIQSGTLDPLGEEAASMIEHLDIRVYEVRADEEAQSMIANGVAEFWARVKSGEPPEPTTVADVKALWSRALRNEVEADEDIVDVFADLARDTATAKEALDRIESAKLRIQVHMTDHDTLTFRGDRLATWKNQKGRDKFDAKRLKSERPDVYAEYATEGKPSRVFRPSAKTIKSFQGGE